MHVAVQIWCEKRKFQTDESSSRITIMSRPVSKIGNVNSRSCCRPDVIEMPPNARSAVPALSSSTALGTLATRSSSYDQPLTRAIESNSSTEKPSHELSEPVEAPKRKR